MTRGLSPDGCSEGADLARQVEADEVSFVGHLVEHSIVDGVSILTRVRQRERCDRQLPCQIEVGHRIRARLMCRRPSSLKSAAIARAAVGPCPVISAARTARNSSFTSIARSASGRVRAVIRIGTSGFDDCVISRARGRWMTGAQRANANVNRCGADFPVVTIGAGLRALTRARPRTRCVCRSAIAAANGPPPETP